MIERPGLARNPENDKLDVALGQTVAGILAWHSICLYALDWFWVVLMVIFADFAVLVF